MTQTAQDFTCPACGASPGYPCTPLRPTGHPFTLTPHWQRGRTQREIELAARRPR